MYNAFSYSEYEAIIRQLTAHLPLLDFPEVKHDTPEFLLVRHDIEFSVDRAVSLAMFESQVLNMQSSYLFQLRNNCYNIISDVNVEKLHNIHALGHRIGLHCNMNNLTDINAIHDTIAEEAYILSKLIGIKIDRFSFHRPSNFLIKNNIQVTGLINCYDSLFFHYFDKPHDRLNVKYLSDSRHEWHYGHPMQNTHKKVQLLTHPYSWSLNGANNFNNYKLLLEEKSQETRHSINRETSTFPPELLDM